MKKIIFVILTLALIPQVSFALGTTTYYKNIRSDNVEVDYGNFISAGDAGGSPKIRSPFKLVTGLASSTASNITLTITKDSCSTTCETLELVMYSAPIDGTITWSTQPAITSLATTSLVSTSTGVFNLGTTTFAANTIYYFAIKNQTETGTYGTWFTKTFAWNWTETPLPATSTAEIKLLGSINFGLAIIILVLFLFVITFSYNQITKKKPWLRS